MPNVGGGLSSSIKLFHIILEFSCWCLAKNCLEAVTRGVLEKKGLVKF